MRKINQCSEWQRLGQTLNCVDWHSNTVIFLLMGLNCHDLSDMEIVAPICGFGNVNIIKLWGRSKQFKPQSEHFSGAIPHHCTDVHSSAFFNRATTCISEQHVRISAKVCQDVSSQFYTVVISERFKSQRLIPPCTKHSVHGKGGLLSCECTFDAKACIGILQAYVICAIYNVSYATVKSTYFPIM